MEDGCRWSCELFIKRVESRKSGKHGDMRVISRMNSDEFVTKLLRGSYDLTTLYYIEGLNGEFFFLFFRSCLEYNSEEIIALRNAFFVIEYLWKWNSMLGAGVWDTCRRYVARTEVSRDGLFSRRKVRIGKVRVERCSTLHHELVEDYYLSWKFSMRCAKRGRKRAIFWQDALCFFRLVDRLIDNPTI